MHSSSVLDAVYQVFTAFFSIFVVQDLSVACVAK